MDPVSSNSSTEGYWEPHTSSIDFCESNYLHSNYVAEIHNVWPSILGLSAVGIFGLIWGNPTKETRYALVYFTLIIIGIGSACLHGTLHWLFQSSDELPMVYLVICLSYCIVECESPRGRPKYPLLPAALIVVAIANTAIYYKFQHLYAVFIATFTLLTLIATVGLVQLIFFRPERGLAAKRLFWHGEFFYLGIGLPVWMFDMLACNRVLNIANDGSIIPRWMLGITPHVIWHFAAGLGAYILTLASCCCRLEVLGITYEISYIFGRALPIVRIGEKLTKKRS